MTLLGIDIEVSEFVPLNAELPIEVTLFGMFIEVRELAPLNALVPIEARALPDAKVTVLRAVVRLNAISPIEVMLLGMVIEVRALALLNAYSPIEVTLFGMVIEVRALAPSNALFPIEARALPAAKDTVWRALALWNARLAIDVTLFGITASPAQFVLAVTTLSVIVKVPPELQLTATLASALTIVRPFHVVASPKPVAAKPMFATGSLPTELKASVPTVVGAFPSKVTEVSEVAFLNANLPMEVTLLGMAIEDSEVAP